MLHGGVPEGSDAGWRFEAGAPRMALPYSFVIGPSGEFWLDAGKWVPLHASIEGWVEALALADHARRCARTTTTLTGAEVDDLELDGFEVVPEVAGLADPWWRGSDSLIAVYRGEAQVMEAPRCRTATIYAGLDAWGLRGLDGIVELSEQARPLNPRPSIFGAINAGDLAQETPD